MRHTVLFVTCCLNVGILSASIEDSNSSERSSTAFSKSLYKHKFYQQRLMEREERKKERKKERKRNRPLVILKQIFFIPLGKIISHSIRPLQRRPAFIHFLHCLFHELHFDPCQRRCYLHLFHLLLGFGVEVEREFGRLFVVSPTVVVLFVFVFEKKKRLKRLRE